MRRSFVLVVGLALLLSGSQGVAHGQAAMAGDEIFIKMLRLDVRQAKRDIIGSGMQFTSEDAALFWPVYDAYQEKLSQVNELRVALVKEYAGAYWSLTDSQARDMAGRWFDYQQQRATLFKELYDQLAKALSPSAALKASQLEHRLNLIIDMQLASELPMLE